MGDGRSPIARIHVATTPSKSIERSVTEAGRQEGIVGSGGEFFIASGYPPGGGA